MTNIAVKPTLIYFSCTLTCTRDPNNAPITVAHANNKANSQGKLPLTKWPTNDVPEDVRTSIAFVPIATLMGIPPKRTHMGIINPPPEIPIIPATKAMTPTGRKI